MEQLPVDMWEIPRDDITLHEEIGRGFFGTVYKGSITKLPDHHPQQLQLQEQEQVGHVEQEYTVKTVAVKMLKGLAAHIPLCMPIRMVASLHAH